MTWQDGLNTLEAFLFSQNLNFDITDDGILFGIMPTMLPNTLKARLKITPDGNYFLANTVSYYNPQYQSWGSYHKS